MTEVGINARVAVLVSVAAMLLASASPAVADDVGLVDPASGEWQLRSEDDSISGFYFGSPGDVPFAGDWDCDGVDTPGLYRQSDGYVYLRNTNDQGLADVRFFLGNPGDVPIAGDFNGDGCDTVSIYRPSEGRFFIINELGANEGGLGAAELDYLFGNPGDKPFIGDFDGDGVDTVGLHRESTGFVYFRNSHTQGIADSQFFFGDPGDRLVAGDWGVVDGVDTPGVFRPSNTTFYFRHTNTQGNADATLIFGETSWLPVAGNWTALSPPPPPTPPIPPPGPLPPPPSVESLVEAQTDPNSLPVEAMATSSVFKPATVVCSTSFGIQITFRSNADPTWVSATGKSSQWVAAGHWIYAYDNPDPNKRWVWTGWQGAWFLSAARGWTQLEKAIPTAALGHRYAVWTSAWWHDGGKWYGYQGPARTTSYGYRGAGGKIVYLGHCLT